MSLSIPGMEYLARPLRVLGEWSGGMFGLNPSEVTMVVSALLAVGAFHFLWKFIRIRSTRRHNQALADRRRAERDHQVQQINFTLDEIGLTPKQLDRLPEMSAVQILKKIKKRTFTAVQMVKYFLLASKAAHTETNCITEVLMETALARAKQLDQHYADTNELIGPLHGLPISIKECIQLEHTYSTWGYASWIHSKPRDKTAHIVDIMLAAGAIPIVKTNVPQTLLTPETSNLIYGICTSPWNKSRTPGGSSGGEAALIASGGSPLGIGTDIGGSVRIPAHFSGIFALKPTYGRYSLGLLGHTDHGNRTISAVFGPMGRATEDIELFMKVAQEYQERVDRAMPPLVWNEQITSSSGPLKIGYVVNYDFFEVSGSCQRAVMEAVDALRRRGHEVTLFEVPRLSDAISYYFELLTADENHNILSYLHQEYLDPSLAKTVGLMKINRRLQRFALGLLSLIGYTRFAKTNSSLSTNKTVLSVWKYTHAMGQDVLALVAGTFLYNVINFPAGIVPVTTVKQEDIRPRTERDLWDKAANRIDANSQGLPVGVQIIARPFREEMVVRVMKEIEQALPFNDILPIRRRLLNFQ
eukprot:TRINITY_DN1695_c0_g1_i4.p1 TRINITY_DN1695_c0_g1~~TRINITY_DN1695_c0_g1_i4.p1  ORF type:complete len:585 (-),score=128.72 TRINITY_DN1695_c0_g1_i4:541-2295(-)